jgi:hypothetical protein
MLSSLSVVYQAGVSVVIRIPQINMDAEKEALKAKVLELAKENEFLKKELVRVGSYGDDKKKALLLKVVIAHPDCYTTEEFAEAFGEATEKD